MVIQSNNMLVVTIHKCLFGFAGPKVENIQQGYVFEVVAWMTLT